MTNIYSGSNLFGESYEPDLPYRKLLCAVIKQAIFHARGLELDDDGKPTKLREGSLKATAIEYLKSRDFELDCEDLELPCSTDEFIRRARAKIEEGTYQLSIDKEAVIAEYNPKKVTQKELAKKYGVTQQRISQILPSKKRTRLDKRAAEKIAKEYHASNITQKEIAYKYRYSVGVISRVINNNYAHLAGEKWK